MRIGSVVRLRVEVYHTTWRRLTVIEILTKNQELAHQPQDVSLHPGRAEVCGLLLAAFQGGCSYHILLDCIQSPSAFDLISSDCLVCLKNKVAHYAVGTSCVPHLLQSVDLPLGN